jgi:ComF family protein
MRLPETDAPRRFEPRPKPALVRAWDRALDLVFPPRCVACDAFGALICDHCQAEMVPAEGRRCETCWMPLDPRAACRRCWAHRPRLHGVRSAFVYEAAAREAVLALKFRGLAAIAPIMARPMAAVLADWQLPVNCIVPVPLSGRRRRQRGYNQAEVLASEISRLTGIPLERRALGRRHQPHPQARTMGDARWQNVARVFRPGKHVPSGPVLLVDDVITTGATLDAAARVLLSGGARPVFALTFARED